MENTEQTTWAPDDRVYYVPRNEWGTFVAYDDRHVRVDGGRTAVVAFDTNPGGRERVSTRLLRSSSDGD